MTGGEQNTLSNGAQSDAGTVDLQLDGQIAMAVLNRPSKLNALTPEMLDQLDQLLARVDADPNIRALIVASAGDRAFCAGADIKRFATLNGAQMWAQWTRRGHQVFDRLAGLRQPTVAAVDGNAYGGGFELALACDLRVVAEEATLGLTEVGLGTVPGWGGTQRLPHQIGAARAKELVFTGQPLSAVVARDWGLVNRLVPAAEVADEARRLALDIAVRAPVAVQMAKQALDLATGTASGMAIEGLAAAASAGVPDFHEGLDSFLTKRSAHFTGLESSAAHQEETAK